MAYNSLPHTRDVFPVFLVLMTLLPTAVSQPILSSRSNPTGLTVEPVSPEDRLSTVVEAEHANDGDRSRSRIIPTMENSGAIALFVAIGCAFLLTPIFIVAFLRRRRQRSHGIGGRHSRASSVSRAMLLKRSSRASVASFDSFRDEVKRPERVMSFKRPWESDRGLDGVGAGYDSGPGRKPTLTSRYSS